MSKSQLVYNHILESLLCHRLRPGDSLNRRDLVRELNVSISPVGEALQQLEFEGILETKPRSETKVRKPSIAEIMGIFTVRIALECEAARIICGGLVSHYCEHLVALAERVDQAPLDGPWLLHAEVAFHRSLVKLSGCQELLKHFDQVTKQSLLFTSLVQEPVVKKMSHAQLIEALRACSPEEAQGITRAHLRHGKIFTEYTNTSSTKENTLNVNQSFFDESDSFFAALTQATKEI